VLLTNARLVQNESTKRKEKLENGLACQEKKRARTEQANARKALKEAKQGATRKSQVRYESEDEEEEY
jgi:hypothetical protein